MHSNYKSPTDWYLVFALLQFHGDDKSEEAHGYSSIWENTYLVKANHPLVAYDRGVKLGKKDNERLVHRGKMGTWEFAGIKQVLPIYEELVDGSEIMWADLGKLSEREIESKILTRNEFITEIGEKSSS